MVCLPLLLVTLAFYSVRQREYWVVYFKWCYINSWLLVISLAERFIHGGHFFQFLFTILWHSWYLWHAAQTTLFQAFFCQSMFNGFWWNCNADRSVLIDRFGCDINKYDIYKIFSLTFVASLTLVHTFLAGVRLWPCIMSTILGWLSVLLDCPGDWPDFWLSLGAPVL